MLRRFQITTNRSLDGVLDVLNSKHMTDAGPLQVRHLLRLGSRVQGHGAFFQT